MKRVLVLFAHPRTDELDQIMQTDRTDERHDNSERGWMPPPRNGAGS